MILNYEGHGYNANYSAATEYITKVTYFCFNKIFLIWREDTRFFSLGAVVDGVCQYVTNTNPCGVICDSYVEQFKYTASGEIYREYKYDRNTTLLQTARINLSAPNNVNTRYYCNQYVFSSLDSAQAFYDTGDTSGVLNYPSEDSSAPDAIKKLFFADGIRKDIRISFPNGERDDITADSIVEQSFSLTESICSRSSMKLGLCESSVVQVECVGIEDIKGLEIAVHQYIDVSSLTEADMYAYGTLSENVPYPCYSILYGIFVVHSCKRSSDMETRTVIAYTKESEWNAIPNPLERAKTNGLMDLQYYSPYKFNVGAVVYSNAYEGARQYFEDVTACTKQTFSSFQVSSMATADLIPIGANAYGKGYLNIYFEAVYVPITSNDVADKLYWLKYGDVSNVEEFKTAYEKVLNDYSHYGWSGDYSYLDLDEVVCAMKHGFFKGKRFDYENGGHTSEVVALDNHRYIYPFVNYADVETEIYDETYAEWQTVIAIPYAVKIELKTDTTTTYSETFIIRDSANANIYTVNNLPQVYMEIERAQCSELSNYGYRVPQTSLPIRSIVEAFAELNGVFGKRNRNGEFEFVQVNNLFGVYPSDDTYPGDDTYPSGSSGGEITSAEYISLWHEESFTKPYSSVEVTFVNENDEEITMAHDLVDKTAEGFIEDEYQVYSLTDNYLIRNGMFTEDEVESILATVAQNINGLQYMPSDIELIGMPWAEAGDAVVITADSGDVETIIMRRMIQGTLSLIDNFESR